MTRLPSNSGTKSFIWMEKTYLTLATATGVALNAGVIAAFLYLLISLASTLSIMTEFFRLASVVTSAIVSAD